MSDLTPDEVTEIRRGVASKEKMGEYETPPITSLAQFHAVSQTEDGTEVTRSD